MKRIGQVFQAIMVVLSILFILWMFVSWLEVISKNLKPEPTYNEFNFFQVLVNTKSE